LLALETRRLAADTETLAATHEAIQAELVDSSAGSAQRATSASITRKVLERLAHPAKL
jgi:hypothetical protein